MKITDLSLQNRTAVVVLTFILILGGIVSYQTIPKESNPTIEIPLFIITTIYPGIGPADMESQITQPLERELQGISGVDEIRSITTEGFSNIIVEFDLQTSLIEASQRVRERVDMARSELPTDAEDPIITEFDFDDFPIMSINLSADYPLSRLTEIAERLEEELEALPGIREVDVIGGVEREVQVNVDLAAMNGYNMSFGQVINAIQGQNITMPGGTIDVGQLSYLLRVSGEIMDPSEIETLMIHVPQAGDEGPTTRGVVYVRDIADVIFGFKDRESYSRLTILKEKDETGKFVDLPRERLNAQQVVSLQVKKRPGANILDTAEGVFALLEQYPLPAGTQVVITGDASEDVRTLINDLENSIIMGMLLVVLVLVFFLGIRVALLVAAAVPLSILMGFIIIQGMGYTVNFVILFSLIIALGLLVDNAIVMVENIYRWREQGLAPLDASKKAGDEIGYALIACTATLVAAFVPMLFWPGVIGQFMGYLPFTLIIVLICSLFAAMVLYPTLTAYLTASEGGPKRKRKAAVKWLALTGAGMAGLIVLLANWVSFVVLALAGVFFLISYRLFVKPFSAYFRETLLPGVVDRYKEFLAWMLQRDYTVKRAYLRNTLSLVALTSGVLLLIAGGFVSSLSQASGLILLIPGGIALVVGLIGILVHTHEAIFRGGKMSVTIGLSLVGVFGLLLLITAVAGNGIDVRTIIGLMALPAVIIVVGFLGTFRKSDKPLILTDNRALLINLVFGSLMGIMFMMVVAPPGVEFFPEVDPRQLIVTVEGPIGTNVDATDAAAQQVYERIREVIEEVPAVRAGVENILVNVGISMDPFAAGSGTPEEARVNINMVEFGDRQESSSITLTRFRERLRDIPDMRVSIDRQEYGPPTGPPVNIEVSGEDFRQIVRITREITELLRDASETGRIPGLVDVQNNISGGLPEYRILIDQERANQFGLSVRDIAQTVRVAINGIEASKFRDGEDEYDIVVRLRKEDREQLESLEQLGINQMGRRIPLVSVADFVDGDGLGSITRLNLRRTAIVEGQAAPGYSGPQVLAQVQALLAEYRSELPLGYEMKYTGEAEEQDESFAFLSVALGLGFALIFLVLLIKFNNLSSAFIVVIAVGLSLTGVLLGLVITRTNFGLMTFIGVISLAGIVCINNIVLIDYIRQLIDRGYSKTEAIIEGGAVRLRPVLLTALTTIFGLIPLTFGINFDFVGMLSSFDPNFQLGSENTAFWGPMGIAIISGLIFATFLTLVVVPVIYSSLDSFVRKMGEVVRGSEA
jgi:multidrug efflux pump